MIYAAILAGGIGKRLQLNDKPKQYLLLDERSIIAHTALKFTQINAIEKIIVVVPKEWHEYTENLIKNDIILSKHLHRIIVINGGADRSFSLLNAVNKIESLYGISENDIVITHDAVRPFINKRIINENIEKCYACGAAGTVYPMADTPVVSYNNDTILDIPIRTNYYVAQTPQTFNIKQLKDTFASLTEDEKNNLTDACKIFVIKNLPVKLVIGEWYNFKITTTIDYEAALVFINKYKFLEDENE